MKCFMNKNVKMPTNLPIIVGILICQQLLAYFVGILTFNGRINAVSESFKSKKNQNLPVF